MFVKGHTKVPGSGRKKGQPNKITIKFRETLASHGVVIELELAKAILAKDVDMVEALTKLMPYISPKYAPVLVTPGTPNTETKDVTPEEPAQILEIIEGKQNTGGS